MSLFRPRAPLIPDPSDDFGACLDSCRARSRVRASRVAEEIVKRSQRGLSDLFQWKGPIGRSTAFGQGHLHSVFDAFYFPKDTLLVGF